MGILGSIGNKVSGAASSVKGAVVGAGNAVVGEANKLKDTAKNAAKDLAAKTAALVFFAAIAAGAFFIFRNATYRNFILGGLNPYSRAPTFQKVIVWGAIVVILALAGAIRYYSAKYKRLRFFDPISQVETLYGGMKNATIPGTPFSLSKINMLGLFDEGFTTQAEIANDITLLTSQPLTLAQAGLSSESSFDPGVAVLNAMQAGFRSFVLYIDYKDADKDTPLLVYRDAAGAVLATGSISEFSRVISASAFRADASVPNYTQPVIVYLHILRAPSPVTSPEGYKKFLGAIATELKSLAPNHLGSSSLGKFNRQAQEETLLTTPLSSFGQSVIILCNADTSLSKNTSDYTKDLDFYVNMRVYSDGEGLGVTQPYLAPTGAPSAVVTKLSAVESLNEAGVIAMASKGKSRFVIALPEPTVNPKLASLKNALAIGINMIPINMILETPESAKEIGAAYSNVSWIKKSANLI